MYRPVPIVSCLPFSRLKQVLEETDGSLGTHLRQLEDVGYLARLIERVG